jgi:hypothetical protein
MPHSTDNKKMKFISDIPKIHQANSTADIGKLPLYVELQKNINQDSALYANVSDKEIYTSYEPPIGSLLSKMLKLVERPRENQHLKKEITEKLQRIPEVFVEHQYEEIRGPKQQDSQNSPSILSTIKHKEYLLNLVNNLPTHSLSHIDKQKIIGDFEENYAKIQDIIVNAIKTMQQDVRPIVTQPQKNSLPQTTNKKNIKDIMAFKNNQRAKRNEPLAKCLPDFCLPSR